MGVPGQLSLEVEETTYVGNVTIFTIKHPFNLKYVFQEQNRTKYDTN